MQNLIGAVLAVLLALALRMPAVQAATFNIAAGDVPGFIAAINLANANGVANTINLAGGAYTLTAVNNTRWEGPNGLPPITSDLTINGYLAVKSSDGTLIARSTVSGTPAFRVFSVIGGKLTLNNVSVSGGLQITGNAGGGALFNGGGTVTIVASTIGDNRATEGAGILNYFGTLTVVNSTISGNETLNTLINSNGGAGILNFAGRLNVGSSTFAYNREQQGRGHSIADAFSPSGFVNVKNSILSGASAGAACNGISPGMGISPGVLVSHGRNIAGDNSCALTAPGDLSNVAPMVDTAADNGGPTRTHMLLPASPAIDTIPAMFCTDFNGVAITQDQRGKARPQGPVCDSGAVERVPITMIAKIPVHNPQGIAVDPGIDQVYVASQKSSPPTPPDSLVVINENLLAIVGDIALSNARMEPRSVVVNTTNHRVYVSNFYGGVVTGIDGVSKTVYATSPNMGVHPIGLTVDPGTGRVYVVSFAHSTVRVLDGTVANLPNLSNPSFQLPLTGYASAAAAFNPQTGLIYVTETPSNKLLIINGAGAVPTGISGTAPSGPIPQSVAINHKTARAYVTNQNPYTVTVVDLSTNTVVGSPILVGAHPRGIAVNPETNRIYVVTNGSDRLKAIDGATNNVIANVPTGGVSSGAVAVSPKSNRAYVTNNATPGSVTVFDLGDP